MLRSSIPRSMIRRSTNNASIFGAAAFTYSASSSPLLESYRSFSSTNMLLAKNPYKVLKVPQGASVADIKKAYRKLSMKYHPDMPTGDPKAFAEVQDAYESIKTGVYTGPRDGTGDKTSSASRWQGFRYKTADRDSATFDDVMRDLHSKSAARGGGGQQGGDPSAAAGEGAGAEGAAPGAKKPREDINAKRVLAWYRLMAAWSIVFIVLRISAFFVFPPKIEKKHRPNPALLQKNSGAKQPPPPARVPSGHTPQAMH